MHPNLDLHAFFPPIFSIVVSLYQLSILDHVLSTRIRAFIETETSELESPLREELAILVDAISRDRVLQVAYLAGLFALIASLAATLKASHATWTFWVLITMFILGLLSTLSVFLHEPGFLARTRVRPQGLLSNCTWEHFYIYLLLALNIIIIAVMYAAQVLDPSAAPRGA